MFRVIPFLCCVMLWGCSEKPAGSSVEKTQASPVQATAKLALNWYPEVEHGGFIAANTLDLFKAENIEVEIIPGGPGAPQAIIAELAAERIEFAVSDADNVVKARSAGLPIVALMAPLQNSPRCIMVHEASGITSLEQLTNVELAISDSRPFALWMKKKLPLTNVKMVPFNGLVGEFLLKPDFAQQGYVFSEPFVAKEKGGDPRVLLVSDIGFNPYASVLITTEKVIQEQPELVRSVVTASVKGWQEYLAAPVATNVAIHEMNKDMSIAALEFGAKEMVALCKPAEGIAFCGMEKDRWDVLVKQIEEIEDIPAGSVKSDECFTTKFLQP